MVAWWRNGKDVGLNMIESSGVDSRSGSYQVLNTWMGDYLRTGKL